MHFALIVLLRQVPDDQIDKTLDAMLEPFRDRLADDPPFGGEFDWRVVGGRFTGFFDDVTSDLTRLETCGLCDGTGKYDNAGHGVYVSKGDYDTCQRCLGKGKVLYEVSVSSLKRPLPHYPYAVLTPNGDWHDEHKAGAEWRAKVEMLLDQHNDAIAVIVDCHS